MEVTLCLTAALLWILNALLSGRRPLCLEGRKKWWFLTAAAAVNLWTTLSPGAKPGDVLLVNVLLWMAATDLRERMLYDVHFYILLLGGLIWTALQSLSLLTSRSLLFLVLLGVLFLASRKSGQLGMGDSRTIAALALYFPLSGWMEVMLLSLGGAMVWGVWGLLRKKKTMKTEFPFAPFLLAGVLIEYALH